MTETPQDIVCFDPIDAPGGYVPLVYEEPATPRRSHSPTVDGRGVSIHLGYVQKKIFIVLWHPIQLDITSMLEAEEVDGYVLENKSDPSPVIDKTVNLFTTEAVFTRYIQTPDTDLSGNYRYGG